MWGLLIIQQCSQARQWQEAEINLLYLICAEIANGVQRSHFRSHLQKKIEASRVVAKIIDQIGRFVSLENIFEKTSKEVRTFLKADRVAIFRFDPNWSGEFVAESVASGWTSVVEEQHKIESLKPAIVECEGVQHLIASNQDGRINPARWADTYFQEAKSSALQNQGMFVRDDVYQCGFPQCYLDVLEQYEVKAYATIPLFQEDKLWGMLATYQNSGPRQWQDWEVRFLCQVAAQLSVALQQAESLEKIKTQSNKLAEQVKQEQAVAKVIDRIRRSLDLDTLFEATSREVRAFLKADRVAVYRFHPDWSGEFVAESVGGDWKPLLGSEYETLKLSPDKKPNCRDRASLVTRDMNDPSDSSEWQDTYWQNTQGENLSNNDTFVVKDIYQAGLSPCYVELLEKYQVRSYALVPVFLGDKAWGMLAAYQNSGSRQWLQAEVQFLQKIATQFGIALRQAETLSQSQTKSSQLEQLVEQEQTVAKVISRIRQSIDLATIFEITAKEVRSLLQVDRVAVYRFRPDWSGEFLAESVAVGWTPLLEKQEKLPRLQDKVADCAGLGSIIARSKNQESSPSLVTDTYFQETQGNILLSQGSFVRDDIYQAGFSPCYLEILEQFEARAYVIVPVFQGEKLWGLLAAFHNSGPRAWQDKEVRFIQQVGGQFSVAVQQAEYIARIQNQTKALAQTEQREKNFIRFLVKINQQIVEQAQQKLTLDNLFKTSTKELRKLLKVDRVTISRFNPDWNSQFICEDVNANYARLVGTEAALVEDPDIQDNRGGRYLEGKNLVMYDPDSTNLSAFELEWLEQLGVKACVITPIFEGESLWGLLGIYQHDRSRLWEEGEVNLIAQASLQLGIAIQQADYLEQVKEQSQQLIDSAEREKAAKELLQERAAQLLISVKPAFTGNLMVRAPITDDEIGTIADAYNGTLQSLRKIVLQVQDASEKVAQSTQDNTTVVQAFADQAQEQFQKLKQALKQIQQIANSTQVASASTQKVETAVQQANQTWQQGDNSMNLTVENILKIRETFSETLNSIKRLSESCQKISKVVQLLGNFTSQTNLVAMNAALEATRAGEYGRGFAVVAEEVRSLSHQSSTANTEIEELVEEIQTETAEVLQVMEMGLQEVTKGTDLVNESRESLNAILAATSQISDLVGDITEVTKVQDQQAEALTKLMKDVGIISNRTYQDSTHVSASFQALLEVARDLQTSAGKFKVS